MTSPPQRSAEQSISLGWLDAVTRHRKLAYGILVGFYLLSFNGIWRIGVDSALYRGLARSIARGDGYFFAGEHHTHAYAGLPLMLACIQKVFGNSEVAPLLIITLMALVTLWLIDATLRLRYPLWVATIITLGVGLNYRFVRQSQELMTDIPFALGVMMSLYAYERLKQSLDRRALYRMVGLLTGGLLLAAATRPTFGVLALAIVFASAYAAVTNRDGKRSLHLAIVGAAVCVALLLIRFDPRTAVTAPFEGRYELELREAVAELPSTIYGQLRQFLGGNLNDAFFSQDMNPMAVVVSVLVLFGGVLVWRRNAVWGMMIFGLVLVTLPLSTVPRYYIMVMPMLWLGWLLLLSNITLRSPRILQGAVMLIGIGLPLGANVGRVCGFIFEQRRPDWEWITRGTDRHAAFYAHYRNGAIVPLLSVAKLIGEHTETSDTIIGPSAHVLAYFADRRVVGERSIFFEKALSTYPQVLKKTDPDYAVYPTNLYAETDPTIRDLMRRRILVAMGTVASSDEGYLARVEVRPPPDNVKWTAYTGPAERTATTRKKSHGLSAEEKAEIARKRERKLEKEKRERRERRERIERRERQERRERIERREKLERRERLEKRRKQEIKQRRAARERTEAKKAENGATTVPSTGPTTAPTTRPSAAPSTRLSLSGADFPLIQRPAWLGDAD